MKLFKTVDKKFAEIGFVKIKEDKFGTIYERKNIVHSYTQRIHLAHKQSGMHITQSYDVDLMDGQKIGNTCVGLTMYELQLCLKKMRQMGWKPVKETVGDN